MIENIYLSYFAAGICIYTAGAGILLTIVGVKRANFIETLIISSVFMSERSYFITSILQSFFH